MKSFSGFFKTAFPKAIIGLFLIFVCIYCLFPFVWMLSTSLKTEAEAFRIPPTWIPIKLTVDSYIGIWVRKNFGIYFLNSTIISLATALLSTFFGAMAGYGFSRFFFKGRKFLIGFFLAAPLTLVGETVLRCRLLFIDIVLLLWGGTYCWNCSYAKFIHTNISASVLIPTMRHRSILLPR